MAAGAVSYNYLPLAGSGVTPGKKMLGLVVVRQNRQSLGYAWALLRVLAEYVCVGACYGMAVVIFVAAVRSQMHGSGRGLNYPATDAAHSSAGDSIRAAASTFLG